MSTGSNPESRGLKNLPESSLILSLRLPKGSLLVIFLEKNHKMGKILVSLHYIYGEKARIHRSVNAL